MHRPARWGLGAICAGVTVITGLEVAGIGDLNMVRRTISEHGLGPDAWIFGTGLVLLAAGSAAIGLSLARRRLAGIVGTLALMTWSLGLMMAGLFHKHDWSVGPSLSGNIHRVGSFVAFLCLPLAIVIISRPWRHRERRASAVVAFGFGICSVLYVAGMGVMMLIGAQQGLPWYRVMPLGLVERGLAITEIAGLVALGVWAAAARLGGGEHVDEIVDVAAEDGRHVDPVRVD
jgi:hypothetical membrane protein